MSKGQDLAKAFNLRQYYRIGQVSVRREQKNFYVSLLSPRAVRSFTHKTLGKGYTLYK